MKTNQILFIEEFSDELIKRYKNEFNALSTTMQLSGCLVAATQGWLKEQIAKTMENNDTVKKRAIEETDSWWERQGKIKTAKEEDKKEYMRKINMNPTILNNLSLINSKCYYWSKERWEPYVSQIFLEKKDYYDEAKFKIIRIPKSESKLVNELYHRIKAEETSLEDIALEYGHASERMKGGCIKKTRLNTPQPELVKKLRNRNPGELIPPFKLNEWYIIIEIINIKPAELNKQIKDELIEESFVTFIKFATNKLIESLLQQTEPTL